MTAALFALPNGALSGAAVGDCVALTGAEGKHAATVKRIGPGEQVLVADGSGCIAECVVVGVGKDRVDLRIDVLTDRSPAPPRLTLVQALAKADRDDQAVEAATELGVDEVVPWQAERSIVQWKGERGAKAARKWEQLVHAAAKQSRRSTVPAVSPLLTRSGIAQFAQGRTVLVLHEEADLSLGDVDLSPADELTLVVGPEGGISPAELDAFAGEGARVVRLGPTVLRASSAGPAALAIVLAATRWRSQPDVR